MQRRPNIVNRTDAETLFELDSIFLDVHEEFGFPPNWKRPQGFISLSKTILEQQVSIESGKAHFKKLNDYISSFEPYTLLQLSDEEFRECQISKQKAAYLRGLSTAVSEGELNFELLSKMEFQLCRDTLTSIKGIGYWTTDIYQMICLQEKDIFPPGDVAIIKSARALTDLVEVDDIIERSNRWRPFRSLASYYLWHYNLSRSGRTVEY
ncbi:DNA-3-methyladenine glycosylase 2 family protein [Crocinitomix catalasitica]|nr:DNA-3-methyladenine glycosylase 2 family protein [Crocinitomix catalasitica]